MYGIGVGEGLQAFGILLDLTGVAALTLAGVFGQQPWLAWKYLRFDVNRKNPEATEKDPPFETVSPIGGGLSTHLKPNDPENYDRNLKMVRRQTIGAFTLIAGLGLQFIGILL